MVQALKKLFKKCDTVEQNTDTNALCESIAKFLIRDSWHNPMILNTNLSSILYASKDAYCVEGVDMDNIGIGEFKTISTNTNNIKPGEIYLMHDKSTSITQIYLMLSNRKYAYFNNNNGVCVRDIPDDARFCHKVI